jgi:hypothetical protein
MIKILFKKKCLAPALVCLIIISPFFISFFDSPTQSYTDFFIRGAHNSLSSIYSWSPEGYGSNIGGSIWRLAPLSIIYALFTNLLKLSSGESQFIVCSFLFAIGYLGYLKIVPKLLGEFKLNSTAIKITGLFYLFNTYTLIQFSNSFLLVIPYLLLPVQIWLLLKSFETPKRIKYVVLFALVNASCFGINLIFDVISLIVLLAVAYFIIHKHQKVLLKRLVIFFVQVYGLSLVLCSFWLIPQLYSSLTDTQTTQYVLQSEQFYNSDSSIFRVLRGLGEWSFYSGQNNIPYNSFATAYKTNVIVIIAGYVTPLLSISSVFLIRKNKDLKRSTLWLLAALILIMVVIVGTYPGFPTSLVAQQVFNHVPFALAFRNTYKFASIEMLLLCLLSTISLSIIFNKLAGYKKWLIGVGAVIIGLFIGINAFPFFTNQLYSPSTQIKSIPSYWQTTANYVNRTVKNDNYVFMLPNQYFEALDWNGQFKSFPRNLEETLFKPSAVHNSCAGCGQYLTSNFLNYAYTNLSAPGIFNLLGLTGNSLIVQRNDYNYKYYNVQSPSQIRAALANQSAVKEQASFGQLDIYKISSNKVNPIFYSPQKLVATDSLDNFATIANNNAKSTSILLSKTISPKDKYSLPNSNYYQGVFNAGNTTVNAQRATSKVDAPRPDAYQLTNSSAGSNYHLSYSSLNNNYSLTFRHIINAVNVNTKQISSQSNNSFSVNLGDVTGNGLVVELQQHAFLLRPNQTNSGLSDLTLSPGNAAVTIYSAGSTGADLVQNGSLENGLWEPKVVNCNETSANADIGLKLLKGNASNGNNYLQLSAKQDSACTYTPPLTNFTSGTYLFSVDTKKIEGSNPSYCVWNGKQCVAYSEINASNKWSNYSSAVYLDNSASNFYLYLYAQKANFTESVDDYDNVHIYHLTKPLTTIKYTIPIAQSPPQIVHLKAGQQTFTTALALNQANLIDNPDFSDGPWQSTVQNCTDQSGTNGVGMRVVNSSQGTALDLSTNGLDAACTNSAFINSYGQGNTYLASIKYKVVAGTTAKLCIWNGRSCVNSKTYTVHDHNWHTDYDLVTPGNGYQPLSVYLYAPAGVKSEVQYTDVSLKEVENSFVNSYTLSNPDTHYINTATNINYDEKNPTRYNVSLNIKGNQPALLTYSQSYQPDWKAYLVKNSPNGFWQNILWYMGLWTRYKLADSQHIVTNGFTNGWWIAPTQVPSSWKGPAGQYKLVVDYRPQAFVNLGLVVSTASLVGCLSYLAWSRRRVKKEDFQGYHI